jgi:hypothetical protein
MPLPAELTAAEVAALIKLYQGLCAQLGDSTPLLPQLTDAQTAGKLLDKVSCYHIQVQ